MPPFDVENLMKRLHKARREAESCAPVDQTINAPDLGPLSIQSGRYISYVEDHPMMWTRHLDDRECAITSMRNFVSERLLKNGAGWGAVLDTLTDEIIAVAEIPFPNPDEMRRIVQIIRQ